jgi:uncharacterized protein (UPF0262 family)
MMGGVLALPPAQRAGIPHYWVVDPEQQQIEVSPPESVAAINAGRSGLLRSTARTAEASRRTAADTGLSVETTTCTLVQVMGPLKPGNPPDAATCCFSDLRGVFAG